MGSSSNSRGARFWRADWFLGLAIVAAVLLLHRTTDLVAGLENRFYDVASTWSTPKPSDRIAIIAIDDQSIAGIGRWPWTREVHAQLIDLLAAAKAKVIVHTTFFFEPQTERGLAVVRKLRETVDAMGSGGEELQAMLAQAEKSLDADAQLAASMKAAGNVLVPAVFALGEPQGRPDALLPTAVARSALRDPAGQSVPALRGQYPIDLLAAAAAGVGHLNQLNDTDGAVREEALLVGYHGAALPSMSLLAAAASLNLTPGDLRLLPGGGLQLGRLLIPADEASRVHPQFYKAEGGKPAFAIESFQDVLAGKVPANRFTGKIVLIGATAAGVGTTFAAPGYAALAPVEMMAHVTSSVLSGHFLAEPTWGDLAALGALALIAAYVIALLPRLSAGQGAAATGLLFALLVGGEFWLLSHSALWLKLVLPAFLLVAGHLALTTRRFLVTEAGKQRSDDESAEANRMMGLALQGQGQLDMAFDRFRRVPFSDALMDNLYSLALDFERKRQFNKAQAIYEHMSSWRRDYKDLPTRLAKAKNLSETVILGGGAGRPGGTLVLGDGAVEKPMLGRYQLEKELGKGAMGVVYQGRDPRIGRVVAIKTMALAQEFEGNELEEARKRFFREAETAGRLAHPNIVTIYDAGEEHDLAYMAMEFLHGRDLADVCSPDHLLPPALVVSIGVRVAEALAYAHRNSVVHRDVKPANIMYERGNDTVKVTDFGIARITDSSRTRTGMVLGTPSYMSPEQIAGHRVDGRSDIYSLAVTLFQMLSGQLPFRAESLAELMYKIANQEAPSLGELRPDLPQQLVQVLADAMAKRPDARPADGDAFAAALRGCLPGLDAAGAAPAPAYDAAATQVLEPRKP